jgi:hypothetical protein
MPVLYLEETGLTLLPYSAMVLIPKAPPPPVSFQEDLHSLAVYVRLHQEGCCFRASDVMRDVGMFTHTNSQVMLCRT